MFTFASTTTSLVNILPNNTKQFFAFVHIANNSKSLQIEAPKPKARRNTLTKRGKAVVPLIRPSAGNTTMTAFQPLTVTPVEFSLTDGTQIPAPAPESPPLTPTRSGLPALKEENSDEENQNPQGHNLRNLNISTPNSKHENAPLSPLSATSAGSQPKRTTGIRRYLSLRSLRGESRRHREEMSPNGTTLHYDPTSSSRPGSPYTTEPALSSEMSQSKKNAGWFGSVSGRRKSQMYVIGRLDERLANGASPEQTKPKGPPPPAIPEFSLGNELEMGGDDLFKNIK